MPRDACMRIKAKAKAIKKESTKRAEQVCERLCLDTSGPFAPTLGGNTYWGEICDDKSNKSWDTLMKKKSAVPTLVEDLVIELKAQGHQVKYLRMDNAGEHSKELIRKCHQLGVEPEFTAPNTPQQNGIVERRFVTDRDRAMAMMVAAGLNEEMRMLLKGEAILCAARIGDLLISGKRTQSAQEMYKKERPDLLHYLVEFGRIGYVADRSDIKKKFTEKERSASWLGMLLTTLRTPIGCTIQKPSTSSRPEM